METTPDVAKRLSKPQKMAICAGTISLSPAERVQQLAILASDPDAEISERARSVLVTQPLETFLQALAKPDAAAPLFVYCAENLADMPGIADALAKNPACPVRLFGSIVPAFTSQGVQALLDDLERLITQPELVAVLQLSPAATVEQRKLLGEMQEGPLSEQEIAEAAEAVEPDPEKRQTLFQMLAQMTVVQRLMLALKGGRSERALLIRDPNKLVQRCVLQSPRLTDSEVENFATMTNLSIEVLRGISMLRVFMKNYTVAKNLVNNPKTPLDVSLHLFPRLNASDLQKLTMNKNIPETLRSSATKLHRKRKAGDG